MSAAADMVSLVLSMRRDARHVRTMTGEGLSTALSTDEVLQIIEAFEVNAQRLEKLMVEYAAEIRRNCAVSLRLQVAAQILPTMMLPDMRLELASGEILSGSVVSDSLTLADILIKKASE